MFVHKKKEYGWNIMFVHKKKEYGWDIMFVHKKKEYGLNIIFVCSGYILAILIQFILSRIQLEFLRASLKHLNDIFSTLDFLHYVWYGAYRHSIHGVN